MGLATGFHISIRTLACIEIAFRSDCCHCSSLTAWYGYSLEMALPCEDCEIQRRCFALQVHNSQLHASRDCVKLKTGTHTLLLVTYLVLLFLLLVLLIGRRKFSNVNESSALARDLVLAIAMAILNFDVMVASRSRGVLLFIFIVRWRQLTYVYKAGALSRYFILIVSMTVFDRHMVRLLILFFILIVGGGQLVHVYKASTLASDVACIVPMAVLDLDVMVSSFGCLFLLILIFIIRWRQLAHMHKSGALASNVTSIITMAILDLGMAVRVLSSRSFPTLFRVGKPQEVMSFRLLC
mmetsp:Transcript_141768/g.250499  ORF Transcript_141768/g.250499 Transcript_141768/m.250499 type:complete len:296 (+) Transcript_141768:482-1369(+)